MIRRAAVLFGLAAAVTGCSVHGTPPAAPAPSPVRWVDGPTPDVRTLLLSPIHVGAVGGAGHAPARLDVGAFFARFNRSDGTLDQLALMIEVQGIDVPDLLRDSRQLLLEVDGELFVGEPGVTENSFRVDLVDDAPRATVVIPVSPEMLVRLADAERVRGRLGLWASFTVPPSCRSRFRELLRALPEDVSGAVLRPSQLHRATKAD